MSENATRDITAFLRERVVPTGGSRHGLVIGIEDYADSRLNLRCARNDAQAVYEVMVDPECGMFPEENVQLLLDTDATKDNMWRALSSLRRAAGQGDTVWVYYAGHAAPEDTHLYWVTHDTDVDDLYGTGLASDQITKVLNDIRADRLLVLLDCCHAAATMAQKNQTRAVLSAEEVFACYKGKGRITISSSDGKEKSVELGDIGHGAFTHFLVQGLRGEGDRDGDGVVTANELWDYLQGKVTEASRKAGSPQTPVLIGEMTHDLALTLNPLASRRKKKIADAITALIGLGEDKLTTDEVEFCIDLLRQGSQSRAAEAVVSECAALMDGQVRPATFKRLVQAAMSQRPHALQPTAVEIASYGDGSPSELTLREGESELSRRTVRMVEPPLGVLGWPILAVFALSAPVVVSYLSSFSMTQTVAFSAIVTSAFLALYLWDRYARRASHEAHAFLNEGNGAAALTRLSRLKPPPWWRWAMKALQHDAERERDVKLASALTQRGDVDGVVTLAAHHDNDDVFRELFRNALAIGASDYLRLAQEAREQSDFTRVVEICEWYQPNDAFRDIHDRARTDALAAAHRAAESGDLERVTTLAGVFKQDEGFEPALAQSLERLITGVESAIESGDCQAAWKLIERYPSVDQVAYFRPTVFVELATSLPRYRSPKIKPQVLRCDVSGHTCHSNKIFGTCFEQCRFCGRWVQQKESNEISGWYARKKVWSDELACCRFCAQLIAIASVDESALLVLIRPDGKRPDTFRCEVSGHTCNSKGTFYRCFEQCRLCGRWVQQLESNDVSGWYDRKGVWSDVLACCRLCADFVIRVRKAHKGT